MNHEIFSVFKAAFFLLLKRPVYFFFGLLAFFPGNIPLFVQAEDTNIIASHLLSLPFITSFLSHFGSGAVLLFFVCFTLGLWVLNITAFSWICFDVLSQKKKRAVSHIITTSLLTAPQIALVRISGFLFFFLLLSLLIFPIHALVATESLLSAWFLGFFALAIFLGAGVSFFSTFLFAHFYILFARLSFRTSLHTASGLFLKRKGISSLFVFWSALLFIIPILCLSFLPGFKLAETSFIPLFPNLPFLLNVIGCLVSGALLIFLSSFFPVSATLFFLHISKNKKLKEAPLSQVEHLLAHLPKKKSEAVGEIK